VYLPSVLRPLTDAAEVPAAFDRLAELPFSMLRGRPGSYPAERLAALVERWGRLPDCVWLRAGHSRSADLVPALAAACHHRWSGGADPDLTLTGVRLEDELWAAPEGAVVVLEVGGRTASAATRLAHRLRPVLTERRLRLLTVEESRFTPPWRRTADLVEDAAGLLGPDRPGIDRHDPGGSVAALLRDHGLRHRPAVLLDVQAAARLWSPEVVAAAIRPAHGPAAVLDALSADLVGRLVPTTRAALEVAVATGYWHPQLGTDRVPVERLRPWVVPLEGGWGWVRPVWVRPLRRALARSPAAPVGAVRAAAVRRPAVPAVAASGPAPAAPAVGRPAAEPVLQARLLGGFEVRVDGVPVQAWKGQRGIAVLRYLLARDRHVCSRDELLEEFWPDVPAAAARNRLQVAVSGLRRALLDVTRLNVVEFAEGGYRINPTLRVEVDSVRFEQALRAAAAAERAGDPDAARAGYREALQLYRGDFAADAPFEQWTLLPRESLRIRLVDALDRLSRLELAADRVDDCIATAQRMLELDPCREDAHRLLMRCYARQGRVYRALQQYEFCSRVLHATVDVGPAAETERLRHVIRTGTSPDLARLLR
jgi:DNA-binding SARP family transcriptional activator